MIIYAISDTHGHLPDPPPDADLLIMGGDICPDFGGGHGPYSCDTTGARQAEWLKLSFVPWLEAHGKDTVAIWGNHDYIGEHPHLLPAWPSSFDLLQDETLTVTKFPDSVVIYGTPWVPGLPRWAFHASESGCYERARAIPSEIDILVSHGPPYGLRDFVPSNARQLAKYYNVNGQHVGDEHLREQLPRIRAKALVCGHVHEGAGLEVDESGTTIYNVAAVDEFYNLRSNPWRRIYL